MELKQDDSILNRFERTGFEFLISDLELAMTLVRIAANAGKDPEKKARNRQNARHNCVDIAVSDPRYRREACRWSLT
jgi:hypothetical protein